MDRPPSSYSFNRCGSALGVDASACHPSHTRRIFHEYQEDGVRPHVGASRDTLLVRIGTYEGSNDSSHNLFKISKKNGFSSSPREDIGYWVEVLCPLMCTFFTSHSNNARTENVV